MLDEAVVGEWPERGYGSERSNATDVTGVLVTATRDHRHP